MRQDLIAQGKEEVISQEIGDLITKHLKKLDHMVYVGFASVYGLFEEPEDFQTVLRENKMKQNKKSEMSSHRPKRRLNWLNYRLEVIPHVICMVLCLAFAGCTIASFIIGNLAGEILAAFFCVVFIILAFKIRRLRLKIGPLLIEVDFCERRKKTVRVY